MACDLREHARLDFDTVIPGHGRDEGAQAFGLSQITVPDLSDDCEEGVLRKILNHRSIIRKTMNDMKHRIFKQGYQLFFGGGIIVNDAVYQGGVIS
jgi:hypothetical protein